MERIDLDDDDDDDEFVRYFRSLKKNSRMLMNDIHQHLNLRMNLKLEVQYDLRHYREHFEPKNKRKFI
jgi:hypothetical protein